MGGGALYANSTGSYSTVVGVGAGGQLLGSANTILGNSAGVGAARPVPL